MILLCKEYDKYGDRGVAYRVVKKEPTDRDIWNAGLRSRLNPEFKYYVTTLDKDGVSDEVILMMFERKANRKPPMFVRI